MYYVLKYDIICIYKSLSYPYDWLVIWLTGHYDMH